VGTGTTFKLSLPFNKTAYQEREISEATPKGATVMDDYLLEEAHTEEETGHMEDPTHENEKPLVLAVEDNPDLRTYIQDMLKADYQVQVAGDGKTGIARAIESIPDLIISDIMMPEMDGFEFCKEVKTNEKTSHVPVILLTAKAGQEHKMEGLQTGADAYLTKPFDRKELRVRAAKLIEQRQLLKKKFSQNGRPLLTQPNATSMDEKFAGQVVQEIEANLDNEFYTVDELAQAVGFSRSQLFRKMKAVMGLSPTDLIRDMRLESAHELLKQRAGNVSEIAYQVGYNNLPYFIRSFKKKYVKMQSEI
jgi:DNA-binding response OmpR family regulator